MWLLLGLLPAEGKIYIYHETNFNPMKKQTALFNWTEEFMIKIKPSQLINHGTPLNRKFINYEINSFQNNWLRCHRGNWSVAYQLIKSFEMLDATNVSCTGDRYHGKICLMSQILKMIANNSPKSKTKLRQWHVHQKRRVQKGYRQSISRNVEMVWKVKWSGRNYWH